jgi:uridine kinase
MPAGLDGNPHPIRTPERDLVLRAVGDLVCGHQPGRTLVGVDGRSGSGKSTFADELGRELRERGVTVIRSTTDSFHRPRAERMRRGVTSPEGYYADSHQLDRIVTELLRPFRHGAAEVLLGAFDEPSDTAVETSVQVGPHAVLVFDGLFLHRPEFAASWDVSVFLDADERRDAEWLEYLLDGLPVDARQRAAAIDRRLDRARWPRYRQGWSVYVDTVSPSRRATVVIDNNDLGWPRLLGDSAAR